MHDRGYSWGTDKLKELEIPLNEFSMHYKNACRGKKNMRKFAVEIITKRTILEFSEEELAEIRKEDFDDAIEEYALVWANENIDVEIRELK
jgi:hypothetical protein